MGAVCGFIRGIRRADLHPCEGRDPGRQFNPGYGNSYGCCIGDGLGNGICDKHAEWNDRNQSERLAVSDSLRAGYGVPFISEDQEPSMGVPFVADGSKEILNIRFILDTAAFN